jgi:hypothetical protein
LSDGVMEPVVSPRTARHDASRCIVHALDQSGASFNDATVCSSDRSEQARRPRIWAILAGRADGSRAMPYVRGIASERLRSVRP